MMDKKGLIVSIDNPICFRFLCDWLSHYKKKKNGLLQNYYYILLCYYELSVSFKKVYESLAQVRGTRVFYIYLLV